jgi:hypothetical protein
VRPLAHEVPGKRGKNPLSREENTRELFEIIPLLEEIGFAFTIKTCSEIP